MSLRAWFTRRLQEADLVNLAVIVTFALFLGMGAAVAVTNEQAREAVPEALVAIEGDEKGEREEDRRERDDEDDDDDDDDDGGGGKGKGKGKGKGGG